MKNNNNTNNLDNTNDRSKSNYSKEWYKKWWGIIIAVIFWPYFIIYFAWAKSNWNIFVKITSTIICGFFALIFILAPFSGNQENKTVNTTVNKNSSSSVEQPMYKKIETWYKGNVGFNHYQYTGNKKPSTEEVQAIFKEIADKGCDYSLCEYYLWDNYDSYKSRKNGNLATEIADLNKNHLIGYINTAGMFFYYGVSGNEKTYLIYDSNSKTFIEMNRN